MPSKTSVKSSWETWAKQPKYGLQIHNSKLQRNKKKARDAPVPERVSIKKTMPNILVLRILLGVILRQAAEVSNTARDKKARKRLLVVRQDIDGSFKYSLNNLEEGEKWERYARVQGQRFWIEHAFRETKSQLGMARYQVRVWKRWHHHMSLVCMALLFTMKVREDYEEQTPLLSTRDIEKLLDYYIPRRSRNENEVLEQITKRHEQRKEDLEKRKRKRTGIQPSFI